MRPAERPSFNIPFELHVTVAAEPARFAEHAAVLGVRPVHVQNLVADGSVVTELLTVSAVTGDDGHALAELDALAGRFTDAGFDVIRRKAEAAPWHPDVPVSDHDPDGTYFEAHIRVTHPLAGRAALVEAAAAHGSDVGVPLYVSWDEFKPVVDGSTITMMTMRSYTAGAASFTAAAEVMRERLDGLGSLAPLVIEWAVFDSNVGLDDRWMASSIS